MYLASHYAVKNNETKRERQYGDNKIAQRRTQSQSKMHIIHNRVKMDHHIQQRFLFAGFSFDYLCPFSAD